MPRLNQLEDILFPIEQHPVFVRAKTDKGERRLSVPHKMAIVAKPSWRVLGIVSRSYRLVHNEEALAMAYECCRAVFPETKPSEWGVEAADAPATASYCHIDLSHNSAKLDFRFVPPDDRPELFGPFIRVTNSYNGQRALAFDVGFHRKVCKNGLVLPDTIIRFKFAHQHRDIGKTVQFEIAKDKLAGLKTMFTESLAAFRALVVRRAQFRPLICGVFGLRPPQPLKPGSREAEDWATLVSHLDVLVNRYTDELGENAYAAFNAVTDFASHPPDNRCVHRDRHGLQRLAGLWLSEFNRKCGGPNFQLADYLQELATPKARAAGPEVSVRGLRQINPPASATN